jgi:putative endonuclease
MRTHRTKKPASREDPRKELGEKGEDIALRFLKKRRYRILERNYRCRHGEIDIIARQGKTLAFIEVKTRSSENMYHPFEQIHWRKQRQISKVALSYLIHKRLENSEARFDVVGILVHPDKVSVELIKDAFDLNF